MITSVIYQNSSVDSVGVKTQRIIADNFPLINLTTIVSELNDDLFKLLKSGIDLLFFEVAEDFRIDQRLFDRITEAGSEIVLICTKNNLPIEIFNQKIFYYLEIPLSIEKIKQVTEKFQLKKENTRFFMESDRISVPVKDGWEIIDIQDIMYCQADSNYTDLYLKNGKKRKISKPLKSYAECLSTKSFVRVHQSYLVNSSYMKKLSKDKSPSLFLSNGVEIPVSRSGKKELLKLFL
jgi:two-component system LytT family response regulator